MTKPATGLDRMVVTLNFDPPHGRNWDVRDDVANPGNWKPGDDRWYRAELRVNARTGERKIFGLPFLAPPPPLKPTKANPVPGAQPGRIDQGADYNLSSKGGVAPYKCKVLKAYPYTPGWRGGWLVCEILEGPFTGQGFYVAEGVKDFPPLGAVVPAGGHLCNPDVSHWGQPYGNCEWGWVASDAMRPLAQQLGARSDHDVPAVTCGLAFDHFVRGLGGPACTNFSRVAPQWALLPAKLRTALGL